MVNYTLKEKILKYLIENKEKAVSIRELSKNLNADYKNTSNALKNLNSETYLKRKSGNTYLIEFQPSNNIETFSIENKRKDEFLSQNPKLRAVKNYVENLDYPFMIVLIFGSSVKGSKSKGSDIDLCIISDNKKMSEELEKNLDILSLNLEIQNFNTNEFVSILDTKRENVGKEIIKNNVILFGVENYYNLISKWMKK